MIHYMLTFGTAIQRHLLFQCCKKLFLIHKTPICCRLTFYHGAMHFNKQCLSIYTPKIQRLHIANNLVFAKSRKKDLLSRFISTFWRCDAQWIEIRYQELTIDEVKFLITPKRVWKFEFLNGKITMPNGKLAAIEDIMELLPVANNIS